MSTEILTLDNLDATKLPELQGLKESQLKLVEENPYIEIVDNKTFEEAKKNRTALLKGRTSLESQEKLIASKLSNFRKQVGTVTKELIDITLPYEEKQQEEVKRYEKIKEDERMERERLENLRVEKIKNKISELEASAFEVIQTMTFAGLETDNHFIEDILSTSFDFEEFDILWNQAKTRIQNGVESKINDLQEKENQRIENERLRKEKEESDAKLKAIQDQQEKEREEREAKEREEKEKVFEVRKNRLFELGYEFGDVGFVYKEFDLFLSSKTVFECDIIDFENLFNEAKNSIQEAKENYEKLQAENEAMAKAEIEAKKKADKENNARVKRLAKDKAIYKQVLYDKLDSFPIVFDSDQEEIKNFSINASCRVTELLNELLTDLENL